MKLQKYDLKKYEITTPRRLQKYKVEKQYTGTVNYNLHNNRYRNTTSRKTKNNVVKYKLDQEPSPHETILWNTTPQEPSDI